METNWKSGEAADESEHEHECMAATLEAQHGIYAAEVADFFSNTHHQQGNAIRAWAWAGVANLVRRRARERTGQDLQTTAPLAS